MRDALCVVLCTALFGCAAYKPSAADLRAELEAMYDTDQAQRLKLQDAAIRGEALTPAFIELVKAQHASDQANMKRLERIVEAGGWPKRSAVGNKASSAAFLVVQHSDLETQKRYLPMLKAAVAAGEAQPADAALLEDRVLIREGKAQLYGSQLQPRAGGGWEFSPIQDEAQVDARRQAVGLPPLAEYAKEFGIEYRGK